MLPDQHLPGTLGVTLDSVKQHKTDLVKVCSLDSPETATAYNTSGYGQHME